MSDKSNLPTVLSRMTEYLDSGGLWNPELADHAAVRGLILDARAEIDALHRMLATLREHLVTLQAERENVSSQLWDTMNACAGWEQRAERAERILVALREPSESMRNKVFKDYWSSWGPRDFWTVAIRAAVAAAEQEVGRE